LDRNRSTHEAHGEELKTAAKIFQGRRGAGGNMHEEFCATIRVQASLVCQRAVCFFMEGVVGHEAAPSAIVNKTDPASCDRNRCTWLLVNGYDATASFGQLNLQALTQGSRPRNSAFGWGHVVQ